MITKQKLETVSIMSKLKHATQHLHAKVEQLAYIKEIMSNTLSLYDYYSLILKNYIFHVIVEDAILATLTDLELNQVQFSERRKIGYLYEDLAEQNRQGGSQVAEQSLEIFIQSFYQHFRIDNYYEALGAMYVLEGATLGGNIIKRELSKNPEIIQHTSFHYYGCYGKRQGMMWSSFKHQVEQMITTTEEENQTVNGAMKTFDFLALILERNLDDQKEVVT